MSNQIDRRQFLVSGAAVAGWATGVRSETNSERQAAQDARPRVRMNLSDPMAAGALRSYKTAIAAMLKLPPEDPRNWYRNAFIHLLDCPHGNWWLLPWHRGYLGWFEETCQTLSNDPSFTLPYWDWTAEPYIPSQFTEDSVLNPANPAFIAGLDEFKAKFSGTVGAFYANLSQGQKVQLNGRRMATPTDFWSNATGMFFSGDQARQPQFDDSTRQAVSLSTVLGALAPKLFEDFGSGKANNHSDQVSFGILEGQPHNSIHNAIMGLMGDMLSPIDPIFFMHHSNLDRLWDVWTRRQQANQLSTMPNAADLAIWQSEPFLFYVDRNGTPVPNGKAGDYAATSRFNYTYQPGSGEQVVTQRVSPRLTRSQFAAALSKSTIDFQGPLGASASIPATTTHPAVEADAPQVIARITLQPPENPIGSRFHVLVNALVGAKSVGFNDPSFAGTFSIFGNHRHGQMSGPMSFEIPLTGALRKLRAAGKLKADEPLRIQIVPDTHGVTLAPFQASVKSITINTT